MLEIKVPEERKEVPNTTETEFNNQEFCTLVEESEGDDEQKLGDCVASVHGDCRKRYELGVFI